MGILTLGSTSRSLIFWILGANVNVVYSSVRLLDAQTIDSRTAMGQWISPLCSKSLLSMTTVEEGCEAQISITPAKPAGVCQEIG